jgi:DNA-binding transcriptional regulator YiaG
MKTNIELIAELEQAKIDKENNLLFQQMVVQCMEALSLSDHNLARRFGISRPSITRWTNGTGAPHPAMRIPVYDHFIKLLKASDEPKE